MSKKLTKSDLIESLSHDLEIPESMAEATLNHLIGKVVENLAAYGEVTLSGFGAPITLRQKAKPADNKTARPSPSSQQNQKPEFEQRKLRRRNFILDIEVLDRKTNTALGDLGDITSEGIMVVSEDLIEENKLFSLKVKLPEEAEEELEFFFDAVSVRCQKTIHEKIFITGFKIENLDQENRKKIEQFIDEYAV